MTVHPAVRDRAPVPAPEALAARVADAHTHLDACGCETPADVQAAMARAHAVGVTRVVTVADDLDSARWAAQAATWHPDLYAAVALHPTRADRLDESARSVLEELAGHHRVVAIGETGLDHHWEAAPHDVQAEAFAWHIDLAKRTGKALMIHDRNAHDAVFDVLDSEGPPDRVIFHCFSGDAAMAAKCADRGFVMSFAGPVTFRNAVDLQAAARVAPADLLLVETDAPFLTPHPHRGRRNEPYALPYTVRALAGLRGQGVVDLCEQVNRTTEAMFGIRVN
ncbi:TatD DNase family protein [Nakamurella panacisegetis]|uniref:TatD DNase family protein n=1 Tax=Nakamurella panacisegetis TaxID=1090615 RepID=A0A1H0IN98_9ACTN|nr:TatD DNase family protein [Nakamurella panacisegetis]